MLEQHQQAQQKWGGVDATIDAWLQERQILLTRFVDLPQTAIDEDVTGQLRKLCETLVDYTSMGHFTVYEQILMEAGEVGEEQLDQVKALLGQIHDTTDAIVIFDDEYGAVERLTVQDIGHFNGRLSRLGETLTERFGHEDQMIEMLYQARSHSA